MKKNTPAGAAPQPERIAAPSTPKSTQRSRPKAAHSDERGRSLREQETANELFERVDEDQPYVRPTSTEAPPARPDMKQRWIRVGMPPNVDEKNLVRKLREGWRARHASSVPRKHHVPRVTQGRFAGCIMVEGLLLCEMPMAMARKRAAYVKALTQLKTDAVNQALLRVNEGVRGGFGPVKKGESSKLVREVRAREEQEQTEETEL